MTKVQKLVNSLKEIKDGCDIKSYDNEQALAETIRLLEKYERRIMYDTNQYEASVESQERLLRA